MPILFNAFNWEIWQAWVGFGACALIGIGLFGANPLRSAGALRTVILILGIFGMLFFGYVIVLNYAVPGIVDSAMAQSFADGTSENGRKLIKPLEGEYEQEPGADKGIIYVESDREFVFRGIPYEKAAFDPKEVKYIFIVNYHDNEKKPRKSGDAEITYNGYYSIVVVDPVTWLAFNPSSKRWEGNWANGLNNYIYNPPAADSETPEQGDKPDEKALSEQITELWDSID